MKKSKLQVNKGGGLLLTKTAFSLFLKIGGSVI